MAKDGRETSAASSLGIGKLKTLAFRFGRMVKNQAVAAVERVKLRLPLYYMCQGDEEGE